jgi:hypothetical protein
MSDVKNSQLSGTRWKPEFERFALIETATVENRSVASAGGSPLRSIPA